jgi:hypothetical protein
MQTRHWTLVALTVVAVGAGGACAEGLSRNDDVFSESRGSEGGGGEAADDEDEEGTGGGADVGGQVAATTAATTTSTSSSASSSSGGVDGECDHATHLACGDGECVLLTMVCNGITDCATGADEAPINTQCPTQSSAAAGGGSCGADFACNDGSCIPAYYQCDGWPDCGGYEDEVDCPCDGVTCGDGSCIPDYYVCDGYVDCDDDEVECEDTTSSSSAGIEEVPVEWTCNAYYYGDDYYCDCGCGVLDPDCETSGPEVCDFCSNSGGCSTSCTDLDPAQNWLCL